MQTPGVRVAQRNLAKPAVKRIVFIEMLALWRYRGHEKGLDWLIHTTVVVKFKAISLASRALFPRYSLAVPQLAWSLTYIWTVYFGIGYYLDRTYNYIKGSHYYLYPAKF